MEDIKHKIKIYIIPVAIILIVAGIYVFTLDKKDNMVNNESSTGVLENTNDVSTGSYYDRFKTNYKNFQGEEVDFNTLNVGDFFLNEEGYYLFPYKSINELYNVYKSVRDEFSFEDEYMTLDQSREFDGFSGANDLMNVNRGYKCSKDKESIEIYAESLGNVGADANKVTITVRGEGWDRVKEINKSLFEAMGFSEDISTALNKSGSIDNVNIKYSNDDRYVTITISKRVVGICESSIVIYNNTDDLNVTPVINVNYENTDGIVTTPDLVYSDKSDNLSFENIDKLYGKVLEDYFLVRTGEHLVDCDVKVRTKGTKGLKGENFGIIREETYYVITYKSESGKYEVGLDTAYTDGSSSVEVFINKTNKEIITEEERKLFKSVLYEFLNYLDKNTDIASYEVSEGENTNTTHFSVTDSTGQVLTVSYNYYDDKSSLQVIKSASMLSDRSASYDTYK